MCDLARLAAAIRDASPEDAGSLETLQQEILASAEDDVMNHTDVGHCEQTLACIFDSFHTATHGKEVLDQVLLDILPHVVPMAHASADCAHRVSEFCSMAADCCSPRDTLTALLAAMDQLINSPNPAVLQLLCSLMGLLPALLAKLNRRTAAFTQECLLPVANLAQVHGQVLQDWQLAQLQPAAAGSSDNSDAPQDIMRRMDTFLAANWQQYASFVDDVLHKVLRQEPDPDQQQSCKKSVGTLILQLLWRLTAAWPPPVLTPYILQLLKSTQTSSVSLPTSVSVLAPTAMLPVRRCKPLSKQTAEDEQQSKGQQTALQSNSEAGGVVRSILGLMQECGLDDLQDIVQDTTSDSAAGAALAKLYVASLPDADDAAQEDGRIGSDRDLIEALQTACYSYCCLVEASQGHPVIVLKATALLQQTAAEATLSEWSATPAGSSKNDKACHSSKSQPAIAVMMTSESYQQTAPSSAAEQLLSPLISCINKLSTSIASGIPLLQAQAKLAMQQMLQAPGPAVAYCCFKNMLSGEEANEQVHPEVAALLMQEVRLQLALAQQGCSSPYADLGSAQLVLPWLQQHSAVGWQTPDGLADRANAICSALAVVRLTLLKLKGSSTTISSTDLTKLQAVLQEVLSALSAATSGALQDLQLINKVEQGQQNANSGSAGNLQQQMLVPGEAQGQGQAVDAWLAVSRVQDVLDRVLELM